MLVEKEEYNQVSKLNEVVPSFITTTDIEFYLEENSDIPFDTIYRPKGFFPSNHGELIFNLENNKTYGPYVDGEYFKVSKLLDKKSNGNARALALPLLFLSKSLDTLKYSPSTYGP